MKFIGNGMVWDKDSNKPLCEFKDGLYETEDEEIISKLKEIGFKISDVPRADKEPEDLPVITIPNKAKGKKK